MEDLALRIQTEYARLNKVPVFANSSCFKCNKTLTEMLLQKHGIDWVKVASSSLITACPGCGRTWCD